VTPMDYVVDTLVQLQDNLEKILNQVRTASSHSSRSRVRKGRPALSFAKGRASKFIPALAGFNKERPLLWGRLFSFVSWPGDTADGSPLESGQKERPQANP